MPGTALPTIKRNPPLDQHAMKDLHIEIRDLLSRMEAEMRRLGLGSASPPPPDAFASTAPFCHDRMDFDQWLRWVLIPRMTALLDQEAPLPSECHIAPMAELTFAGKDADRTQKLVALIRELDTLITTAGG